MTFRRSQLASSWFVGVCFVVACSSDTKGKSNSLDGGEATGGDVSTGSAGNSGGKTGGTGDATGSGDAMGAGNTTSTGNATGSGGRSGSGGTLGKGGTGSSSGGTTATGGRQGQGGAAGGGNNSGGTTSSGGAGAGGSAGGSPAGWLHTKGNKIYQTTNGTDSVWMGRGVNTDDIFFCGVNSALSMSMPDKTLSTMISNLITQWKPNFLRVSLAMQSYGNGVSFLDNPSQYKTPMVNVINSIGSNPGVYALVTLRSDASMIEQVKGNDPEATGVPSDSTNTPDKGKFPNGSDPIYQALVDAFANSSYVMFGISNEPGGNGLPSDKISAAMTHAVGVIRAEEDKLGTPHHIVSVQGFGWTSDISYYGMHPLTADNVVYEVHGYPPATNSYTYANLPVIIGEYGSLSDSTAFFADLETKQIPNLAWDFEPYNNCSPDLVNVNSSTSNFSPTAWGKTVQGYLSMHAK
jgi:hypothetical protein